MSRTASTLNIDDSLRRAAALVLCSCFLGDLASAQFSELEQARGLRIRSVQLRGLRFTSPSRLRDFIETREGEAFDPEKLWKDLVRLGNLELFEDPHGHVRIHEGEVDVTFELQDKWSLLPYLNFVRGGGSTQIVFGLYDVNLAGKLYKLGGEYRSFNGHPAGDFYVSIPRVLGTMLTFGGEVLVETTGRTAYEGDGIAVYDYLIDRRWVTIGLMAALRDWLHVGGEYGFERDTFSLLPSSLRADVVPPDGDTATLGARLVLGQVRFHDDYRESGTDLHVRARLADRFTGSDFEFTSIQAGWRGYLRFGRRHNLAVRVEAGRASGEVEFQHEFVLGALNSNRGFLDDQFRGRRFLSGSLEYRANLVRLPLPVFDRMIPLLRGRPLQLQGTLLCDLGGYKGSPYYARDHESDLLASVGAGVRVIVRPLFRAVLRIDVARTLSPFRATDVVIGTQQFF